MSEIDLKHYEKYLKKLYLFAKGLGIKILYKDLDSSGGVYVPSRRKILLEPDLAESVEIAVLLHELGHAIDDTVHNGKSAIIINKAYSMIYTKKYTNKHKKIVLECERRAWANGVGIAKQLKIRLGKWYFDVKDEYIKGYKQD